MKNIDDVISNNLENAIRNLKDSQTSKQVEFRSGICFGMAKISYELGYISASVFKGYNEEILDFHKVFKNRSS